MSIRTRVTPNRAPDSQRVDAPLVLAFGRGWRGEEGLETPPGLAEARRSLRSYVFGRRQRGPIVIREEGVGSGPRPGPGPQVLSAAPCLRAALLGVPGDWRWPFGSALCYFFICLFIYLFRDGLAKPGALPCGRGVEIRCSRGSLGLLELPWQRRGRNNTSLSKAAAGPWPRARPHGGGEWAIFASLRCGEVAIRKFRIAF